MTSRSYDPDRIVRGRVTGESTDGASRTQDEITPADRYIPDELRSYCTTVVAEGETRPPAALTRIVQHQAVPAMSATWVDRSIVPLESNITTVPPPDMDSPQSPLLSLLINDGAADSRVIRCLIAASGFGRTEASRWLFLSAASSFLSGDSSVVPIYVDLSKVDVTTGSLIDATFDAAEFISDPSLRATLRKESVPKVLIADLAVYGGPESIERVGALSLYLSQLPTLLAPARIVVTCRDDLWLSEGANQLRTLAELFQLQPYTLAQSATFIAHWQERAAGTQSVSPDAIVARVKADDRLAHLVAHPLLLALAMQIVGQTGTFPAGIGGLCEGITMLCMDQLEGAGRLTEASRRVLMSGLGRASWVTWSKRDGQAAEDSLGLTLLEDCIREEIGDRSWHDAANELVSIIESGMLGFISEVSPEVYGFVDPSLWVYFAGRHLASWSTDELIDASTDPLFAEPLLMLAESCGQSGKDYHWLLALIEGLDEADSSECRVLAGEILVAIDSRVRAGDTRWRGRHLERLTSGLAAIRSDEGNDLEVRVRAGDVLAQLGDPILQGLPDEAVYFEIEGGPRLIGKNEIPNIADRLKYEFIHWFPQYEKTIRPFRLARHPVTNFEYSMFMESGGYESDRYWIAEEAKMWRRQDQDTKSSLCPIVDDSLGIHFLKDIRADAMGVVDIETMRSEFVERLVIRDRPFHWSDPQLNRSNQPVVGVNLWEAEAYCVWLTERLEARGLLAAGEACRLPTEEEWEAAAVPNDDWDFPWGPDWIDGLAHVRSEPLRRRSFSIGTFGGSPTAHGCEDMVGNVWDWTISEADEYKDRPKVHSRSYPHHVITRGGSWLAEVAEARSVRFRSWDPPCNAYADLGFRVAISRFAPD